MLFPNIAELTEIELTVCCIAAWHGNYAYFVHGPYAVLRPRTRIYTVGTYYKKRGRF